MAIERREDANVRRRIDESIEAEGFAVPTSELRRNSRPVTPQDVPHAVDEHTTGRGAGQKIIGPAGRRRKGVASPSHGEKLDAVPEIGPNDIPAELSVDVSDLGRDLGLPSGQVANESPGPVEARGDLPVEQGDDPESIKALDAEMDAWLDAMNAHTENLKHPPRKMEPLRAMASMLDAAFSEGMSEVQLRQFIKRNAVLANSGIPRDPEKIIALDKAFMESTEARELYPYKIFHKKHELIRDGVIAEVDHQIARARQNELFAELQHTSTIAGQRRTAEQRESQNRMRLFFDEAALAIRGKAAELQQESNRVRQMELQLKSAWIQNWAAAVEGFGEASGALISSVWHMPGVPKATGLFVAGNLALLILGNMAGMSPRTKDAAILGGYNNAWDKVIEEPFLSPSFGALFCDRLHICNRPAEEVPESQSDDFETASVYVPGRGILGEVRVPTQSLVG